MLSGLFPAACPVVTSESDFVLRRTARKSFFLPATCLFPLLRFLLSHDTRAAPTERQTGAKTSGALMGAEGWRAEACGDD